MQRQEALAAMISANVQDKGSIQPLLSPPPGIDGCPAPFVVRMSFFRSIGRSGLYCVGAIDRGRSGCRVLFILLRISVNLGQRPLPGHTHLPAWAPPDFKASRHLRLPLSWHGMARLLGRWWALHCVTGLLCHYTQVLGTLELRLHVQYCMQLWML